MADIASVLRKTIDGLPANTPAIRQKVYEKARATILGKLEARDPRPGQDIIDRQLAAIDKIIGAVEDDYSFREQVADVFADAGAKPAPAPVAPAVPAASAPPIAPAAPAVAPVVASTPVAPVVPPPVPQEANPLDDVFRETARDVQPEVTVEPVVKTPEPAAPPFSAKPASPMPPAIDPAFDPEPDAFDEPSAVPSEDRTGQEAVDAPADTARPGSPVLPRKIQPKPSRNRASLVWGLGLLVLAAGGAFAAWINRDAISEQIASLTSADTAPEKSVPASKAGETPAAKPAAPDATTKFTQRLNQDGSETETGAPTQVASDLTEGKSVSPATQAPAAPAPAPVTPPAAATPAAPAKPAAEQGQQAIAVGQRAIFYEERTAAEQGTADQGNVVWSEVEESPGGDKPAEPAIRAEITYPGRDLSLRMTIRRNGDETLPASHIIEMVFVTPDNFPSGGIDDVLRITFKASEQAPGTPLLGIPAKIADNFFLVALTDGKAEIDKNEQLMAREQWVDIPVIYKTGRRALLTMEKGIPGEKVFKDVIAAWQANPLKP